MTSWGSFKASVAMLLKFTELTVHDPSVQTIGGAFDLDAWDKLADFLSRSGILYAYGASLTLTSLSAGTKTIDTSSSTLCATGTFTAVDRLTLAGAEIPLISGEAMIQRIEQSLPNGKPCGYLQVSPGVIQLDRGLDADTKDSASNRITGVYIPPRPSSDSFNLPIFGDVVTAASKYVAALMMEGLAADQPSLIVFGKYRREAEAGLHAVRVRVMRERMRVEYGSGN